MPHTKEGEHACQIHGKLIEIRDGKYSPAYKNIQYHINMGKICAAMDLWFRTGSSRFSPESQVKDEHTP